MATKTVEAAPSLQSEEISQFTVYAPGGMGYAFWIRADFREASKSAVAAEALPGNGIDVDVDVDVNVDIDVNIGNPWSRSDRGPKVTVWKMKSMNLRDIEGIQPGMEVRLDIEVQSGSEHVRAEQSFIYNPDAGRSAYYEAKGTCRDAAVYFIKFRDPE